MGIMDTLKGLVGGKAEMVTEQVESAIDAAAEKADDATGGKAGEHIEGAAEKAKDVVGDVVEDASE